jgi:predicted alpha-1,2-mannosidase
MTQRYFNSFEDVARLRVGRVAGLTVKIGGGPANSPTAATGRGFTGRRAMKFARSAKNPEVGAATATVVFDSGLAVTVEPDTEFAYLVFPSSSESDRYASTAVALDLLFGDGSWLSETGVADQHGSSLTAAGQSVGRTLVVDQWNRVTARIGEHAAGKIVTAVALRVGGAAARGWIDDVAITVVPVLKLDTAAGVTPADVVDTRRGTNSSRDYSRGNTIPATAVPNGFNFVVPMTDARSEKWLYEYARANDDDNRPVLQALGISHQPSPWMGDRNQLAIMPALVGAHGRVAATPERRGLPFSHDDELARPHEYRVEFANGIVAAATPTMRAVLFRFEFPGTPALVIDQVAGDSSFRLTEEGDFEGWVDGGTSLSVGRSRMYVAGRFSSAPVSHPAHDSDTALVLTFRSGSPQVELRLATSFIGIDQARTNLRELAEDTFESVRKAARALWNERLGVIEVEGATSDQLVTLYSNLYRISLYPNWQHEHPAADVAQMNNSPRYASPVLPHVGASTATRTGADVRAGEMAVNHGFWDTYRTVWPAYSLLYPEVAARLVDGFVQQYRDSGWIARWSSPGHADLMTGTSSDVAFADAVLKGVPVANIPDAYDAALKNATVVPPDDSVGRKGQNRSAFLGFVPSEVHESVSWSTENCINDSGLARFAAHLARDPGIGECRRRQLADEAAYFDHRSSSYLNLYDPATGYLRPRDAKGRFAGPVPFDPEEWGGPYTETNAWTFAFHAPHDGAGLAAMHGGSTRLGAMLDRYFASPEQAAKPGSYGQVIHEMVEARDVRLGQFGMSNQPAHHIPYLYLHAGRPDAAQTIVRDVLRRLFRGSDIGQGYPGDEDNGEMSAWYVFSALGLYPLAVGSTRYALGSPLFRRAQLNLSNGATLTVTANDWSVGNVYVQSARFNDEPLTEPWVEHDLLTQGGALEFDLGLRPSAWGRSAADARSASAKPLRDLTTEAVTTADDQTAVYGLFDDDSDTSVTFSSTHPVITIADVDRTTPLVLYTITSSKGAGDPDCWSLEGWNDSEWIELDLRRSEEFRWRRQTRPFSVTSPGAYSAYRLRVHSTSDNEPASIAEVELLAESA